MVSFRSRLAKAWTRATRRLRVNRDASEPPAAQDYSLLYRGLAAWGLAGFALGTFSSSAAEINSSLSTWLNAQPTLRTWSADFVQTRTLKSLVQPLTATGHVWFAAPNQFHWEIRHPGQTIAIRQANDLYVIYPRLKRAERYPLDGAAGQWRDTLALLDAGFPRSQAEVESRYNVLSLTNRDESAEVVLQPKSASARRMMPQLMIAFSTKDNSLRATELHFADGSILRNDFMNPVLNAKLDNSLFAPNLTSDFKIVEPLKQH
jgi:outer membrane lipoprotein-sorting protein